jgi:hypothetical protein
MSTLKSKGYTVSSETDPTGRNLGDAGAKMDEGKPDLFTAIKEFPNALAAVAEVAKYGAEIKGYGWGAWRHVPHGVRRYARACVRHLVKDGLDNESVLQHSAHAAWNALAKLELEIAARKEEKAIEAALK